MMGRASHEASLQGAAWWLYPIAIALVFGLLHAWWLRHDDTALYWDMGRHGLNALSVFDTATQRGIPFLNRVELLYLGPDSYYPPLYYWASAPFVALFGRSDDAIALTGVLFAALLNVGVFGITRRLGPRSAALLAPIVAGALPLLFDFTHQVMLDLPLTAMVALTLWWLLERPFDSIGRGAVLGLLLGAGFLTKWTYPAFVGLSCVGALLSDLPSREQGLRRVLPRLPGAAATIAVALILALPWFNTHRKGLLSTGEASTHVPGLQGFGIATLVRVWGHLRYMFAIQMDLISVALLVVAIVLVLRQSELRRRALPLLLCLASSIFVWGVLGKHQDPRYSMPQLAAVVPLIALVPGLLGRRFETAGALGIVAWSLFAVVNLAFAPTLFRTPWLQESRLAAQFAYQSGPPGHAPSPEPLRSIFRELADKEQASVAQFKLGVDVPGLDEWSTRYYAALAGIRLVRGDARHTVRFKAKEPPTPRATLRTYPVPGSTDVVEVEERLQGWEREARSRAGWVLAARQALGGEPFASITTTEIEGALVLVRNGAELDGTLLSPEAGGRFLVHNDGAGAMEAQLWTPPPRENVARLTLNGISSLPSTEEIEVDLGVRYPVDAVANDRGGLVFHPRATDGLIFAGPYATLEAGEYRVCTRVQLGSRQNLAETFSISVRAARARDQKSAFLFPAKDDEREIVLAKEFSLPSPAYRVEYSFWANQKNTSDVEVRTTALRVKGTAALETFLRLNKPAPTHAHVFRWPASPDVGCGLPR